MEMETNMMLISIIYPHKNRIISADEAKEVMHAIDPSAECLSQANYQRQIWSLVRKGVRVDFMFLGS